MSRLYFGICPYGTIADVFINTLAGWSDDWLQPCTPDITDNGHLVHRVHQQYVKELTNDNPMSFRDIDWSDRLDDLEKLLESTDKKVWVGNFNSKQARIVKKHFGDDVTTVGIDYEPRMRFLILENVISYYGVSEITDKLNAKIAYNVKYYSQIDRWNKLVPPRFSPDTDVTINVDSFLEPSNYIKLLEDIDGPRNEKQLEYYFTWLFLTQERLNESK